MIGRTLSHYKITEEISRGGALNTPSLENKYTALFEPRFVLESARLLDQMGQKDASRDEYRRFLDFWKDADDHLPEVREAKSYLAR